MVAKFKKNKRQKEEGNFFKITFLVFIAAVVLGLFFLNWKVFQKRAELNERIVFLKQEIEKLGKEKDRYESRIIEIETEEYWERELRESFDYKKEGEQVIGFVFPEEDLMGEEAVAPETSLKEKTKEFFGKIQQTLGEIAGSLIKK